MASIDAGDIDDSGSSSRQHAFASHNLSSAVCLPWIWLCTIRQAALRFLIAERSVALMRVCQPGPRALKCSSTSASRRRVVEIFGFSDLGRPRLTGAASTFAFHLRDDRSGASSGSATAATLERLFFAIGVPYRDDVASATVTRRLAGSSSIFIEIYRHYIKSSRTSYSALTKARLSSSCATPP